jgi:hypothetical protein
MSNEQQRPHEGGSYIVRKDGTLERVEYTRQLHEPDHEANRPSPGADAPPSPARGEGKKRVKE